MGYFKFLGSIKTDSADCSNDVNATTGVAAKRRMSDLDLIIIWKDVNIREKKAENEDTNT